MWDSDNPAPFRTGETAAPPITLAMFRRQLLLLRELLRSLPPQLLDPDPEIVLYRKVCHNEIIWRPAKKRDRR